MKPTIFQKIFGSPFRFFGFISMLLSVYFAPLYFLDYTVSNYGIISACFLSLTFLLYCLAYWAKDLKGSSHSLGRLLGSPAKTLAFLCLLQGTLIVFFQLAYIHSVPHVFLIPILLGITLYLIDSRIKKSTLGWKKYVIFQSVLVVMVVTFFGLIYLKRVGETTFVFPKGVQKEAIIMYGVEGYPPLPSSFLWKKSIVFPKSGLIVTSSLIEDLPGHRRNYVDENGNALVMNQLFVQEVCGDNDILIVANYFTPTDYYPYIPFEQSDLQRNYQKMYDSICSGHLTSRYADTRHKRYRKEKTREEQLIEFKKNEQ